MRSLSDLFRDVRQLAYVTDDIDAATGWFESALGTTPCHTTYSLGGVVVVGEPAGQWAIDVALVNAGPTNLEIIHPVSGAVDIYRDAIRPGVPATFHHIGVRVPDFDEAVAVIAASGRSWTQHGFRDDSTRFGFVDTRRELGHYVEVIEFSPMMTAYFAQLEAESNR